MIHGVASTNKFYSLDRWVIALNGLAVLMAIGVVYFTVGISWRLAFDTYQPILPYNAFGIPGHWTHLVNTLAFTIPTLLLLIATAQYAKAVQEGSPQLRRTSMLIFLLLAFAIFQIIALLYSSVAMVFGIYKHSSDISIFYKTLNITKMALASLSWAAIFYALYLFVRIGNGAFIAKSGQTQRQQQLHVAAHLFSRVARPVGIASIGIGVFHLAEPLLLRTLPAFSSFYPATLHTSDQLSLAILLQAARAITAGAMLIALSSYFRARRSRASATLSKTLFFFSTVLLAVALLDHVISLYVRSKDVARWSGGAAYELTVNALPEIATAAIFATFAVIVSYTCRAARHQLIRNLSTADK